MGVPRVPVFDRKLPVPLSVGRFVHLVDMDVTTLTERDHVGDAIVGVITIEMMKREHVLPPLSLGSIKPAFRRPPTDETRTAPRVADGLSELVVAHVVRSSSISDGD
ncbi:hypothetical protein [Halorubrum coriense]|uniref:hypothetical protein n=1 Tax=Halorubrum coriense TaxID=64713 RepID=UPI00142E9365|nr:hypothetical protein [Halorubrum coriense]